MVRHNWGSGRLERPQHVREAALKEDKLPVSKASLLSRGLDGPLPVPPKAVVQVPHHKKTAQGR